MKMALSRWNELSFGRKSLITSDIGATELVRHAEFRIEDEGVTAGAADERVPARAAVQAVVAVAALETS